MAEEQRDLISDRGSSVLNTGDPQRSAWGRKAALSTLSILVALLIAGQAVTVYFVYQQSGQISKLTKTSQTLQLEALQRKLPSSAKPVSTRRMNLDVPLAMRVLPLAPSADKMNMAPPSNKTEDQVKHLLLQADPRKMFPELKDNLMDNLKSLKKTMTDADWKSFESWMHKWLLFEMAKNPKPKDRTAIPAVKGIREGGCCCCCRHHHGPRGDDLLRGGRVPAGCRESQVEEDASGCLSHLQHPSSHVLLFLFYFISALTLLFQGD
ncbi:HLA class II histocompatibility antigen gamma chain isoform X4 [Aquila chrysaetos chrysaetos]|uniref:HLA class II histocompatibility antigen gamma chain isoform X4 n=1 Tax=Aquila chrysaetos chrysaetos TaxID=223781 RepID=UPI0011772CBA|nr:HLA class II histocompatibility antigen gamma chain isoform X4 [Aquila chrysaetos chrysaetos]